MGKLIIDNCREITVHNYKELPEIHGQQMARVATLGFGEEYTTAEDLLEMCCEGDPINAIIDFPETALIYLWDIYSEAHPHKPLYNCWMYYDEYGSVFMADTTQNVEVGMSNFTFEAHDKTHEMKTLAEDLQNAFFGED